MDAGIQEKIYPAPEFTLANKLRELGLNAQPRQMPLRLKVAAISRGTFVPTAATSRLHPRRTMTRVLGLAAPAHLPLNLVAFMSVPKVFPAC